MKVILLSLRLCYNHDWEKRLKKVANQVERHQNSSIIDEMQNVNEESLTTHLKIECLVQLNPTKPT
jgi:hypothetical protein